LLSLTTTWKDKADDATNRATAQNVVSAAEKLVKAYALAGQKTTRVLKWAMVGMALLLGLWVTIYLRGATVALETPTQALNAAAASKEQSARLVTDKSKPASPTASKGDATSNAPTMAEPVLLSAGNSDSEPAPAVKGEDVATKPSGVETKLSPSSYQSAGAPSLTVTSPKAWIPFVPVAFFLLLYISTAVGTGLRVLVAFQSNQLSRLTGFAVWTELVVALSVAFGLALFYLIGSISFTGQVSMLASNAQNFPTIAVSMSLLGLTAGYLVPLDKLRDRLQKIFAEEKK
jgi:cytoskeletal protein RodZ